MLSGQSDGIAFGDAIDRQSQAAGRAGPALVYADRVLDWSEFAARIIRRARQLQDHGVRAGDTVAIALGNIWLYHEVAFAIWKLGATPNPVPPNLPLAELRAILELARPRLIVRSDAEIEAPYRQLAVDTPTDDHSGEPLASEVADYWKAMCSGGSTGRPKIIVDHLPAKMNAGHGAFYDLMRLEGGSVVLNPGPLYHSGPFTLSHLALIGGSSLIGMTRFDAEEALRLIERHRVNWMLLVPTMMHRIWSLPARVRDRYDLSSLRTVWHGAATCPIWLKRAWIDWLGPERVWELYGGSEGVGGAVISGDEWLARPGSVGRTIGGGEAKAVREDGSPCAPTEVGELYYRKPGSSPPSHYLGAEPKLDSGGWQSIGDLGRIDADGYIFLADRRTDLILRGGANVYPAEVEAAIEAHPAVASAIVISLPCEEYGHRVHAIVEPRAAAILDIGDLHRAVAGQLAKYKLPESYEFADRPLRDDAGKARRSALRAERCGWIETGRSFRLTPGRG